MKQWIDKLRQERTLRPEEFRQLLTGCDADSLRIINEQAREVSLRHFGNRIYIRGLIEISNCCRNNCYYCGIRKGNPHVARYRLSPESILDCCKQGYALGFRTFVLQGGEDPALTDDRIETIVAAIRWHYPDCAITLSLGEKSREAYERFFHAGANRYLLRHETYDATHYSQLHPAGMSGKQRLQCLQNLKETGYQTGTGIMVGSPGQTVEHLIQDILFIEKLRPEMHRSFSASSGYAFCPIFQRNARTDTALIVYLPPDAPFGTDSIDNSSGYTDSRRTGTGDIGRSKCSHAQSVATGGTEKVYLI